MDTIDLSRIDELLGDGDRDLIVALIDIFREESPRQVDLLDGAVRRGDALGIEHAAHAIKSSALNLGAPGLAALASQMERNPTDSNRAATAKSLREEAIKVLHALENLPVMKAG